MRFLCIALLICAPALVSAAANEAPWASNIIEERMEQGRYKDALRFFGMLSRSEFQPWPGANVIEYLMGTEAWRGAPPHIQLEFFAHGMGHWQSIRPLVDHWVSERFTSPEELLQAEQPETSLPAMKIISAILAERPEWISRLACGQALQSPNTRGHK